MSGVHVDALHVFTNTRDLAVRQNACEVVSGQGDG